MNHEGSLELAKRLIELAHEGGADAAKFQSYKAHSIASARSPSYWDLAKEPTSSQRKLFEKYDAFGAEEFAELSAYCQSVGIDFLSTPFDHDAVDFLNPLQSFFKIASADITNVPLLRHVAGMQKPVVLSTGASSRLEIDLALQTLREAGCERVGLLHCVLNYPCAPDDANLKMIGDLERSFPSCVIGYSDHVPPDPTMLVLTTAWLTGAHIIEKHFTHDKTLPGNDHYHAMDVEDLKRFVDNISAILPTLGSPSKRPLASEAAARKHARRSIVAARDILPGEVLSEVNLTCKRPAHGISPVHWDEVVGRRAVRRIADDEALHWADLETCS